MKSSGRANAKAGKAFAASGGFGAVQVKLWPSMLNPDWAVLQRPTFGNATAFPKPPSGLRLRWFFLRVEKKATVNLRFHFENMKKP
jgi:hypothetical protein